MTDHRHLYLLAWYRVPCSFRSDCTACKCKGFIPTATIELLIVGVEADVGGHNLRWLSEAGPW